jgi:hypothetical protein
MMLAQLLIALPVLLSTSSIAVNLPQFPFTLLPLQPLFDNQAASVNGSVANFDGTGNSFAGQFLPVGPFEYDGVTVSRFSPYNV